MTHRSDRVPSRQPLVALALLAVTGACGGPTPSSPTTPPPTFSVGQPVPADPREVHLAEVRQLTFGGENAEAYWSPDGRRLIFQATRDGYPCDQQYVLDLVSGEERRVSRGVGRTTCGFFRYPTGDGVLFSSTHGHAPGCPTPPDRSAGYVWPLEAHDVYRADLDGSGLSLLIAGPGYDAEATTRFTDGRIVFTSDRDGDLDLYTAEPDGSGVRRITHDPGYDGGAFFSPDGTRLVWRASRPTGSALEDYRALLARRLVRPTNLEIFVAGADGGSPRALTANGAANFAPYFLPDSRRVIFSSNVGGSPREFDLFVVDADGPENELGQRPLERITFAEGFDGFPMFSPDGRHLAFASNRFGSEPGETNLFVARWVP